MEGFKVKQKEGLPEFLVTSTRPPGAPVTIKATTEVTLLHHPIPPLEITVPTPEVGLEKVKLAGLDTALSSLCELAHFALLRPTAFTRLGLDCPKGI